MQSHYVSWGLVLLSAACDSYAAYVVKLSFKKLGRIDFSSMSSVLEYAWVFFRSPLLLTAAVTFVAAPALWFIALNRLDLSIAYPVLVGLHLLLVVIIGVFCLQEAFTVHKLIGTVLVFCSLYFFFRK